MGELQDYFVNAIRENIHDATAMQNAIWATYYHKASIDRKPQHHLCPVGEESWCKWQKAKATGTVYKHTNSIPAPVLQLLKPMYNDLTQPELLERCNYT